MNTRLQAGLLALMLPTAPSPTLADGPSAASGDKGRGMLANAVEIRPLGAAAALVTLPFTLPTANAGEAALCLTMAPAEYTLQPRAGDFDSCGEGRHPRRMSDRQPLSPLAQHRSPGRYQALAVDGIAQESHVVSTIS